MDRINIFERMLHRCPEVCYLSFSQVSYEDFIIMEQKFASDTSVVHVFPFVRRKVDGLIFIDLYIWDVMMYPDSYERFIICEGFRLPQECEEKLLLYTRSSDIKAEENDMEHFNDTVSKYFPQWHYISYSYYDIGRAIEHIYFASHCSGIKEILYKADLPLIAYNIDRVVTYNLIGSTPNEIIGNGMPLKLLRIMNHPDLIENLYDEESMKRVLNVYRAYSGYIGMNLPSGGQWAYLEELYAHKGSFAEQGFNRTLYSRLMHTRCKCFLGEYEKFLMLRREHENFKRLRIPKPENLRIVLDRLECYQRYKEENTGMDDMFRARKQMSWNVYEYGNKKFLVKMPETALEMCEEAIGQANCLMDYIREHAKGETTILFMRETIRPRVPFVTIEVKNNQVVQAYAACNSLPSKEVYEFLVEYGKKRWIYCNLYDLIVKRDWDDEEYDEDLWAYAMKYEPGFQRQTAELDAELNDEKFKQLSIEDIIPEILP